ncbi:MAG: DNA alkylation repair protein [Saprospiraceae bacterium]
MTLQEALTQLESLSHEGTKAHNCKNGIGDNQYGVKLGDLRKVAAKIKLNQELALQLWATDNFDAQMLAMLVIKPLELSAEDLDAMVRSVKYARLADWLNSYVVKVHPDNEVLRLKWMQDKNAMAARAGWNLTAQRVSQSPELLDIPALLDRIEREMASADPDAQWTMNNTLAAIGIHHPGHRQCAIDIGERLGIYRKYPVPKGCTSPFAPIWIREMVSRQEKR